MFNLSTLCETGKSDLEHNAYVYFQALLAKCISDWGGSAIIREFCYFWLSIFCPLQKMKNIVAERVIHNGMVRVGLRFPYDAELIRITKGLPDPLWSSQMKCWHIPDSPGKLTGPRPQHRLPNVLSKEEVASSRQVYTLTNDYFVTHIPWLNKKNWLKYKQIVNLIIIRPEKENFSK